MILLKFIENNLKIILLLTGMHFVTFDSIAQNQLLIRGVINNEVTQLPIEGVNIQLHNTYTGTSTNKQGFFELKINKFPAVLTLTHISFFWKEIVVTQIQDDTTIISLMPKTFTLSETEITAGTYNIFKGKKQEVIDYEFLGSNLLILSYNFNKNLYELILTDENFDTISIKNISYLKKPKQIFKDCIGNCNLLTNDSAYQIYYNNELIHLIYATHLSKFLELLGNCIFETQTYLAFEVNTNKTTKDEYAAKDLSDIHIIKSNNGAWNHLLYFINKKNHKKIILDNFYEYEKTRKAFEHANDIYDPSNTHGRYFGEILRFEESIMYKPSFQTVKLINDTIYYFNHIKSKIDIYSNDLLLHKSINVKYQDSKNWLPIIITDNFKNKVYTIFTSGVMYSLYEINLFNGSVKEVTRIKKLFPHNIKVSNGRLYFLYKDLNNIWDKRKLYQGELPNLYDL